MGGPTGTGLSGRAQKEPLQEVPSLERFRLVGSVTSPPQQGVDVTECNIRGRQWRLFKLTAQPLADAAPSPVANQ